MSTTIRIAAAIILDDAGRTLLVRKRGTTAFMQAGGKIEGTESPAEALRRELHEELGLALPDLAPEHLGQFNAPAANEPGHLVVAEIFLLHLAAPDLHPAAEIAEAVWIDPAHTPAIELAPLTRDQILPLAARRAGMRSGQA